mmetsp:Transcript_26121/g.57083  ORF Transcript_26121/g.57083 Transcript_26121/m.57083 type:complete len:258 (-) Transcript_26121:945-1718(-)
MYSSMSTPVRLEPAANAAWAAACISSMSRLPLPLKLTAPIPARDFFFCFRAEGIACCAAAATAAVLVDAVLSASDMSWSPSAGPLLCRAKAFCCCAAAWLLGETCVSSSSMGSPPDAAAAAAAAFRFLTAIAAAASGCCALLSTLYPSAAAFVKADAWLVGDCRSPLPLGLAAGTSPARPARYACCRHCVHVNLCDGSMASSPFMKSRAAVGSLLLYLRSRVSGRDMSGNLRPANLGFLRNSWYCSSVRGPMRRWMM